MYPSLTVSLVEEHLRFSCSLLLGNMTPRVVPLPPVPSRHTKKHNVLVPTVPVGLLFRHWFELFVMLVNPFSPFFVFFTGCPFRHSDPELLKQKLQNYKVSPSGINQVCSTTSTHLTRFSTMRVKGFLNLTWHPLKWFVQIHHSMTTDQTKSAK